MAIDGHEHAPADGSSFEHAGLVAEQASVSAAGARWAVVTARFNGAITTALFQGAVQALVDAGAKPDHIRAVTVPGAVELPVVARELAKTGHYAGIVALGCVIRGETAHFDYVCGAATDGILRVQLDHGLPIGFGLVTCDTVAQAQARAELSVGGHNVGADAARAALEVAGLARLIRSS
ncbi:MAG: 6,7-dimethyl-8-ribityllumazine synthase [Thermoleophilia bacterium]|nr:6,7-dimethyl-8-ribityllumazine synthase [Thermoleophilia bacterium]